MDNADLGPAMESSGHRDKAKALELRVEMLESTIIHHNVAIEKITKALEGLLQTDKNHDSTIRTLYKRTESLHEAELEMKIVLKDHHDKLKKLQPN